MQLGSCALAHKLCPRCASAAWDHPVAAGAYGGSAAADPRTGTQTGVSFACKTAVWGSPKRHVEEFNGTGQACHAERP